MSALGHVLTKLLRQWHSRFPPSCGRSRKLLAPQLRAINGHAYLEAVSEFDAF
jgi:hypothetical protein